MVACSFIIKFHLRRDACKNYVHIYIQYFIISIALYIYGEHTGLPTGPSGPCPPGTPGRPYGET